MLVRRLLPLGAALLLWSASASAEGSEADRANARLLAQQGKEALDARDYTTAVDRFARADALVHAPTLLLELARAEVGLGKWIAALDVYNRILSEGVAPGAPPVFFDAIDAARRELAALTPRVPGVIIDVHGAATSVTIDGAAVPPAALGVTRPVDPGKHVIRAVGNGVAPAEVEVTVAYQMVVTVTLELEPRLARPPSVGPPPAIVGPPVQPEGGGRGSLQRSVAFAALGVGGAGLLMGAITGGLAIAKHGDIAAACPDAHRCTDPQIGAYHTLGALSTAGLVAGGALAVTGVVLLVTAPRGHGAAAPVAAVLGPGWVGAEGRFW